MSDKVMAFTVSLSSLFVLLSHLITVFFNFFPNDLYFPLFWFRPELQKTAKIAKATDTPVTESKETQIFVVSNAAGDKFKCSWESSA